MIKRLFFDLCSTLIDESECAEYRTRELLRQRGAPCREVLERRMAELAAQNRLPYKDAAREFGLETVKWLRHLEKVYDGVPRILEVLSKNTAWALSRIRAQERSSGLKNTVFVSTLI